MCTAEIRCWCWKMPNSGSGWKKRTLRCLTQRGAKDVLHSGIEASRKNIAIQDAAASHGGYDGPLLLANAGFYGILQDQGLLLGIKILFGYLLLAAVLLAVLSAMIPFHKTVKVPVVKAGADMA